MQTYWDYSEKERSELTVEQVESLLTVELMEKGVLKVEKPILEKIEEIKLDTETFYTVQRGSGYSSKPFDCLFRTLEDAQKFVELQPMHRDYDYSCGDQYAFAEETGQTLIGTVTLCRQHDVASRKLQLQKQESAKKANEKANSEYIAAMKKVTEATSGVWDDWRDCQRTAYENKKVIDTFTSYTATCNGDEEVALRFLAKAYTNEQIAAAFQWFGKADPFTQVAEPVGASEI